MRTTFSPFSVRGWPASCLVVISISLLLGASVREADGQNQAQPTVQQLVRKRGLETADLMLLHQYYRAGNSRTMSDMRRAFRGMPFRITGKVSDLRETTTGLMKVSLSYDEEIAENHTSGIKIYFDCDAGRAKTLKVGDPLTVVSRIDTMSAGGGGNERRRSQSLEIRVTKSPVKMQRPEANADEGEAEKRDRKSR